MHIPAPTHIRANWSVLGTAALFAILSTSQVNAQCPGTFAPGDHYSVGDNPYSVATADFNGDGALDLAVVSFGSHVVSILLGDGAGGFVRTEDVPTGPEAPYSVAVADFNLDGFADMVVASGGLSVLLGRGDGTFDPSVYYTVAGGESFVAVGDFNGDGLPDVAESHPGGDIAILLGQGDGTFGTPIIHPTPTNTAFGIAAADFNGDGRTDLVTADWDQSSVTVFVAGPGGTLTESSRTALGATVRFVVAGDFDGDGFIDVGAAVYWGSRVAFLRGHGDGTLTLSDTVPTGAGRPASVTAADLNGDGLLDLVAAEYEADGVVSVFLGDGSGHLAAPVHFPVLDHPYPMAIGDFDDDGRPDVAVVNQGSNRVSVLRNSSPVTLAPRPVTSCPTGGATFTTDAGGSTPTFQWQRGAAPGSGLFVDLEDGTTAVWDGGWGGAIVSGARARALTIAPDLAHGLRLTQAHAVRLRCVVGTDDCGGNVTNTVALTVCDADFNCDGFLDFFDYDAFVEAFEQGDPIADTNADGFLDFFDYDGFVIAFEGGC